MRLLPRMFGVEAHIGTRSDPSRGASNLTGRSKCVNQEATKCEARVKRIAGPLGVPSRLDGGEGYISIEGLD